MATITYYVVLTFVRNEEGEEELIAEPPTQMPSASAATSRARSLAGSKAGVIAFARSGDPESVNSPMLLCCSRPVRSPRTFSM